MLKTPLSQVLNTTKPYLNRLKAMGISTVEDLLCYFPRAYRDASRITPIRQVVAKEFTTVRGTIKSIAYRSGFRRRIGILTIILQDHSGAIKATWFNQAHLAQLYKKGDEVMISGKVGFNAKRGEFCFNGAAIERPSTDSVHMARIVPIYPETELDPTKEKSRKLSSKWLREKIHKVLPHRTALVDVLPAEVCEKYKLMELHTAITQSHFPASPKLLESAKNRLAFEELFLLQLAALYRKNLWRRSNAGTGRRIEPSWEMMKTFTASLPWPLTNAQRKALFEIINDMGNDYPMSRLLEGDTGSGKTVVAAAALLHAHNAGLQTCLLAPTEILAQQHLKTLTKLLEPFGVTPEFLVGSLKTKEKNAITKKNAEGTSGCIVGTHAILQEKVKFKNLGLVIIDEQHRFGVRQREQLREQGSPHVLHMTATPIPRTLALVLYGDQELSILDEMPAGRQKIMTRIVPEGKRADAYEWIRKELKAGRQAFFVFPLINESSQLEFKAATQEFLRLREEIFPDLKLGLLHGQMKAEDKEEVMRIFSAGDLDILVSTAVIEVGVDVPNATIMIIESADRFGLAQLHQFRGRVGRGSHQSYCLLFPTTETPQTLTRLSALVKYNSGFKLADVDLQLRGPGEVYGTAQSGIPDLRMASLSDVDTIQKSREAANAIIENDPELKKYPLLKEKVLKNDTIAIDY